MKTYQISYNDGYQKRVYIVSAEDEFEALHFTVEANIWFERDGHVRRPSQFWFSEPKQLKGLSSQTKGIKSTITPEDFRV